MGGIIQSGAAVIEGFSGDTEMKGNHSPPNGQSSRGEVGLRKEILFSDLIPYAKPVLEECEQLLP